MQFLTLDQIKKQCVIPEDYHDDDEYLEMIGNSAEDMTAALLDCDLNEIIDNNGNLPATIQHAMRMLVDWMYAVNRGSADEGKEIPETVYLMLKLYRQYH